MISTTYNQYGSNISFQGEEMYNSNLLLHNLRGIFLIHVMSIINFTITVLNISRKLYQQNQFK